MTGMIRVSGFVAAAIFAAGVGSAAAQAAPAPADKGAAVYAAQKCSMCHSLDGKGQAKGPLDLPKADLDALITFMVAKKK